MVEHPGEVGPGGRAPTRPAMTTPLSPRQDAQLDVLARRIAESPHNLVARGERGDVRRRHVAEAVALVPHLPLRAGQSWIDVGTGGGLPGLVLAVVIPEMRWTLLDATRKKVEAVRAFAAELGLDNVEAVAGRAEVAAHDPAFRERFDGAISRALASLPTVLELCRGFVPAGGLVAAVKGPRADEEVAASAAAQQALGLRLVHSAVISSTARPTRLVTMQALGPAPAAYPRREGRPRTHPLGGTRR